MKTVNVGKVNLLTKIRANRESHKATFEEAIVEYRKQVVAKLRAAADKAESGGEIDTSVYLEKPEDHTSAYDVVIQMLEMSVDTTVELDHREARQYLADEWDWSNDFRSTTMSYVGKK